MLEHQILYQHINFCKTCKISSIEILFKDKKLSRSGVSVVRWIMEKICTRSCPFLGFCIFRILIARLDCWFLVTVFPASVLNALVAVFYPSTRARVAFACFAACLATLGDCSRTKRIMSMLFTYFSCLTKRFFALWDSFCSLLFPLSLKKSPINGVLPPDKKMTVELDGPIESQAEFRLLISYQAEF